MDARKALRTNYPMTREQREAWNSRPTYSRVLTRCDHCGELRADPDVKDYSTEFPRTLKMRSCWTCFNAAVQREWSQDATDYGFRG